MLPAMSRQEYRAAIGQSDVFLDSIGWSGCNTIFEALIHDLPIVTMPRLLMVAVTERRSLTPSV